MQFNNTVKLRPSELTLDEVRSKISGLHFGQESLTIYEREILRLAECLLDYIDKEAKYGTQD